MTKNINKKPYGETTITKLNIFEQYTTSWIPVFVNDRYSNNVMICDFCSGSGEDSEQVPGSPLRILNTIKTFRGQIYNNKIKISVLFNDKSKEKINELKNLVQNKFNINSWRNKISIEYHSDEFKNVFFDNYDRLSNQPNLLFIDQYGVKQVTGYVFNKLLELNRTDFLFFISSSTMKRFAEMQEFKNHFPDLDINKISSTKYNNIHREMVEYYKAQIPKNNKTKLYPFTLKKGANIYGLIFGSKHQLGVEKFLDLAWDENSTNGEANFDIDNDRHKKQSTLFSEYRVLTKKELFEEKLEEYIKEKKVLSNKDIYNFTLLEGHPKKHASECVMRLKNEGLVEYNGRIGYSYSSCYKKELKFVKVKENGKLKN